MTKKCSQCGQNYEVTDDEIAFLDKISPVIANKKYSLPIPEECPDCRLISRTIHRNEQYFYLNKSAMSGKQLIALYSPNTEWGKNIKIFNYEEWWSDKWDGLDYGKNFDFSRPFFEQFEEINSQVPKVNLVQLNNENSPYTTGTAYCKNCHIINCSENSEDCYYSKLVQHSRDVVDSSYVYDSELIYECFNVTNCYNCKYVSYSQNCSDCWFSDNLKSCKNCFLCTNLFNQEYHFLNKPMKKEEYEKEINEYLTSAEGFAEAKRMLEDLSKKRIYKYANVVNCENSTGDFLTNCKNCSDCYDVNDSEDCKYITVGVNVKDLYDCSNMYLKPELCYQVMGTIGIYNVIFGLYIFNSSNIIYSQQIYNNCSNLFGCSGLKGNKKYCILNKQYTKEEYETLVPKIIEHMKKTGEWGKHFPAKDSPFGFNETVAYEYFPFTKEQAAKVGAKWKEEDKTNQYMGPKIVLPFDIKEVKDDITKQILTCENCNKNYRLILQELNFYKKMGLPVPHMCPECRHKKRMSLRNPRKLYDRKCMKCGVEIKTTYSPERSEIVYCEECYLKAVY